MPQLDSSPHIYQRAVSGDSQDSLSIIASLIEPGQTLLDLGMGTGGLGQYLSQRHAIVADGVTLNPAEAEIASTWYRKALVADLDHDNLTALFGDQRYDCIVCADVLEHLKAPANVLAQCQALLKPGGRLITSVPNAGYCGLIAELILGDFRYRPEGLLDNTHLRFFTRRSLQRFFDENGWGTLSVNITQRSLLASEFKVAFDSLPPAVARHLLATPDALTYQFISVLQPADLAMPTLVGSSAGGHAESAASEPASALYSAEIYLATQGHFNECTKLVAPGRIGDPRQTLLYEIPAAPEPYTHVRFDPADRPGFFRLHHLKLSLPDGQSLWQWQAGQDALAVLANAHQQQILISSPWETSAGALLLLHGDDPWLELPLDDAVLQQIGQNGAQLEVCAGWPMSADYLQASATINTLQTSQQQFMAYLQKDLDELRHQKSRIDSLGLVLQEVRNEKQQLIGELRSSQSERSFLQEQLTQLSVHLHGIEQSTLFRATRPLVQIKMRLDGLMGRTLHQNLMRQTHVITQPQPRPEHPVDIIVPIYRGLEDTRCCLESVLAAPCHTSWRLIVINDCSPEPEVAEWLRVFARRDLRIVLLENPENLGFVASVNRGMALSDDNDVMLLNSDTEVANDWLDRIQRAAYSRQRVASVSPFSNNATICSYPRFCQASEMPGGQDTASLDRLFAQYLAGQTVEVPTTVGFCMYIRRQCLRETGLFDVENFGKGYGEENDFCVRAHKTGWVHLHTLDTFVRHAGGISFGQSKSTRELQAMETLGRLHPRYESDVHTYVQSDPTRPARLLIDIARIIACERPVILNVIHNREGGTLRHIQELAQHFGAQATFLSLTPAPEGVKLRIEGPQEGFALHFALPRQGGDLRQTLRQLQVGHIHYHHLLGYAPDITELPIQLGITHDFTAHDYYSYCPQISLTDHTDRYCGELGLQQCRPCLKRNPAPDGESIESWRARHAQLLSQARYVIAPSADAAQRLQCFVPTARIQVVPHATLAEKPVVYPLPKPRQLNSNEPLKIVVLGALSKIKGADILEEVALLAARENALVEFHLLGFAYRSLHTQSKARLTVHGGYEEKDLPLLLQWLRPDVVWFPAVWPETYSYTLSASLESGLPVVAPNIGAFAERLQNRDWTWLCDWQLSANQWLEFFSQIRQQHFCRAVGPGPIPELGHDAIEGTSFTYRSSYLQSLPRPLTPDAQEMGRIQRNIFNYLQYPSNGSGPSTVLKTSSLRALMRLRIHPALSFLARLIPMHQQRRIKTWLGK
ncbi:methyltransferase domain-containing protein [Rhodoferax sp.]|uniref:methyltransferase domain-containing protein n=1 Tax=Rhodoferax sp. TaxID=50421 RepID=UPI002630A43D|nr:methyltransferase domain-containing protein [Rhodoferax sp.]MDD2919839.1 methyltransferase domain-containing protein [Rhodoferax sp.]